MLRIVHYLNQFFVGGGGEDKAGSGPQMYDGPIGPGIAVQNGLGEEGRVVATVVCGDNYFAENIEKAAGEICSLIQPLAPDLLIAGPAFNAGRYGIACGAICSAVKNTLSVPSVTGMYEENPGVDVYQRDVYIIKTLDSIRGMKEAVAKMVGLGLKLAAADPIGRPAVEGYFPRGELANEISAQTGAERVVAMLLKKLQGQPFETEVPRPSYNRVPPAPGIRDISRATIALVTDGGLVPKGNPDKIESRTATRYGKYAFPGQTALLGSDYEVSHVGYDSLFVKQDPNRLVPVDMMRALEQEGRIGKLYETFFSTAGVANSVETMENLGRQIAGELKDEGVSGVILTST